MLCPNCQQDNSSTNLFCSHCATTFGKQQIRLQNQTKVFMPPQGVSPSPVRRAKSTGSIGWTVIVIVVLLGLTLWIYW